MLFTKLRRALQVNIAKQHFVQLLWKLKKTLKEEKKEEKSST